MSDRELFNSIEHVTNIKPSTVDINFITTTTGVEHTYLIRELIDDSLESKLRTTYFEWMDIGCNIDIIWNFNMGGEILVAFKFTFPNDYEFYKFKISNSNIYSLFSTR